MNGRQTRGSSDLGRRVTRRREELGLTAEELASRAKVALEYLEYLEQSTAIIGTETLIRLARALKISAWALLGEESAWPATPTMPGVRQPGARLAGLDEAECRRLIAPGGTGRVVFLTPRGPAAVPVTYAVFRDQIVFRTAAEGTLAGLAGSEIGFEVDRTDDERHGGWSVLVVGRVCRINHPAELSRIYQLVKPWAGDDRRICLRVETEHISGRRVRAPATPPLPTQRTTQDSPLDTQQDT